MEWPLSHVLPKAELSCYTGQTPSDSSEIKITTALKKEYHSNLIMPYIKHMPYIKRLLFPETGASFIK